MTQPSTPKERAIFLCALIDGLKQANSWCGETHIQKATYIGREAFGANFGFEFVLYRHGPFSFDLRDELSSLRADDLLLLTPNTFPYGPSYAVSELGRRLLERAQATREREIVAQAKKIAGEIGDKNVSELERVATAIFVKSEQPDSAREDRAKYLVEIKPHISFELALEASDRADTLLRQ